jgi:hypothetical protein
MIISTSEATYSSDLGMKVLEPLLESVDPVVQQLKNQHVIISVSSEPGRRVPGRNYSFDDK